MFYFLNVPFLNVLFSKCSFFQNLFSECSIFQNLFSNCSIFQLFYFQNFLFSKIYFSKCFFFQNVLFSMFHFLKKQCQNVLTFKETYIREKALNETGTLGLVRKVSDEDRHIWVKKNVSMCVWLHAHLTESNDDPAGAYWRDDHCG